MLASHKIFLLSATLPNRSSPATSCGGAPIVKESVYFLFARCSIQQHTSSYISTGHSGPYRLIPAAFLILFYAGIPCKGNDPSLKQIPLSRHISTGGCLTDNLFPVEKFKKEQLEKKSSPNKKSIDNQTFV